MKNFSTTSARAIGVQNSLRWLREALKLDSDCGNWLAGNASVIDTLLGEAGGSGTVYAGVGEFNVATINAVAGVGGTNLPSGSALLTVNVGGAFFSSDVPTDSGRLRGGSDMAKAFILLHELAHLTVAAGFLSGDRIEGIQKANNELLHSHCDRTLNLAGGRLP